MVLMFSALCRVANFGPRLGGVAIQIARIARAKKEQGTARENVDKMYVDVCWHPVREPIRF